MVEQKIIKAGPYMDTAANPGVRRTLNVERAGYDLDEAVADLREAVAAEREAFIAQIKAEIDHTEINEMRLVAQFGKAHGEVAVRVGALEAALDAIRARGAQ